MTEAAQVQRDADELNEILQALTQKYSVPNIAASAYFQAVFAQVVAQALLVLLEHKNIVSAAELNKALSDGYHARAVQLRKAAGAIIQPHQSMIKPNGSY